MCLTRSNHQFSRMRWEAVLDPDVLDRLLRETVRVLERAREEVYDILEHARQEKAQLEAEVRALKIEVQETIRRVEALEKEEINARRRLMEASRKFSEQEIMEAHDHARRVQLELGLLRERERQLRVRRDRLEATLRSLDKTMSKADNLGSHMSIALNLLTEDMNSVCKELEEIHNRQRLGIQIIQAQEEERRHIARELHDGPAQSLATLALSVELAAKYLDIDVERAREQLIYVKEALRQGLQEMRKIIYHLRPMGLDDLGLRPTIEKYLLEFEEKSGIRSQFTFVGTDIRLPPAHEIALFRILQEALHNVVKHARASRVVVRLRIDGKRATLMVKDNGIGFDPEAALSAKKSFGLLGIRERAELLNGTLKLSAFPGQGTELVVSIPLEQKGSKADGANKSAYSR